ncbi:DUF4062 domain-containing protein [Rhodopirellula sp. MGV]|uniref:DUF4062 domain-containing protein n=1 Tax=Rhodopirellula sp. MGV TaxID=2023130 RepID=UPI000B95D5E1|nr:DUF4062 domain-containing protein [Rhodopirellula sp. MGV]OYP33854.1 hypothetical protein CGZ80_16795 [Rhodopirellula sp. MGV]PNY37273.1 DUF4062 domain-containing protein [Rhodopirellula baltica]
MSNTGDLRAIISATARDLPDQRLAAQDACLSNDAFPVWMKHLPAQDRDGFKVSMEMVDKADIYIGIYAWRYGWIPDFDNPQQVSITELEFDRAVKRKASGKLKELLIFIMDDSVKVSPADIEMNDVAQQKLKAFKERVSTKRVVGFFKSTDDLQRQISEALAAYKSRNPAKKASESLESPSAEITSIPKPPAFYAEPDYIGSHKFVGRARELEELSDWANPADPTNLLLFEAIGGNGKSMLTWEWTTNPKHALAARPKDKPWAGRFWYSFYEGGASMEDFCQRALAYMTERPLKDFAKKKTAALKDELLARLHAQPWLLILDGLERVLVAYHRIDAAEVRDEEANIPTDQIADRNPCDAIRDEDNDLLRALAAARPSKLLVSSRLTPRVLLNQAGQPINGAKRITLPGLRPPDAEALLRSCGIEGKSDAIQSYLTANCDNHPLVIGILGGSSPTTCPRAATSTPGPPSPTAEPHSTSPALTSSSAATTSLRLRSKSWRTPAASSSLPSLCSPTPWTTRRSKRSIPICRRSRTRWKSRRRRRTGGNGSYQVITGKPSCGMNTKTLFQNGETSL